MPSKKYSEPALSALTSATLSAAVYVNFDLKAFRRVILNDVPVGYANASSSTAPFRICTAPIESRCGEDHVSGLSAAEWYCRNQPPALEWSYGPVTCRSPDSNAP